MPPHTSKLQFTSMSFLSHVMYVSKTSELVLDYCCMSLNVKFVPNKADSNRMRKSCKLRIVDALQTSSTREHSLYSLHSFKARLESIIPYLTKCETW